MRIIKLASVDSTNTYLKQNAASLRHGDLVYALDQTAGRGQRGNSWESAPGQNITCSILLRWQDFPANRQFIISQAVSLAIVQLLKEQCGIECCIKWPNDIYYQDSKICGILIEHSLIGSSLDRTIVGIGININQHSFLSDTPNPISVYQITGCEYDIEILINRLSEIIEQSVSDIKSNEEDIHRAYMHHLWRGQGCYPFHDVKENRTYHGSIHSIALTGHLTVIESAPNPPTPHTYAFKEVEWPL